jgi:uncharacterized membrane protein YfcA
MIITILQSALALLAAGFSAMMARAGHGTASWGQLRLPYVGLGAVTNFFDTLGIGSFAPTTAAIKAWSLTSDERIPGTLNVGHALPSIAQALIFITLVEVDVTLLISCILAAVFGAWTGARIVSRMNLRVIRLIIGVALLIAAGLFAATNLQLMPGGGTALALHGPSFGFAVMAHLVLGALMAAGVGLYAPSLILLSLLGLNPKAAFPIMMGACAFLMPVAGITYLKSGKLSVPVALGLAIGGIPAVLLAAFVVKELPLEILRWLVVVVVLIAATSMLREGLKKE